MNNSNFDFVSFPDNIIQKTKNGKSNFWLFVFLQFPQGPGLDFFLAFNGGGLVDKKSLFESIFRGIGPKNYIKRVLSQIGLNYPFDNIHRCNNYIVSNDP